MTPKEWAARPVDAPVTGLCDGGCGQPATWWFGLTNHAHCGAQACLTVLEQEFLRGLRADPVDEDPFLLRATIAGLEAGTDALRQKNAWQATKIIEQARELNAQKALIGTLQAALLENHRWHQLYDEHGGYPGSALDQTNVAALSLSYGEALDQAWHEGSTESGRTQHDYLYMSWPPTDKQIRHFLVGPLRLDPELFNSSATKTMPDLDKHLTDIPERSPVHNALRVHLDHLLNNLLPICHGEGPAQVLAASLVTVQTMRDLGLIDPAEVQTLTAHVRAVCEAHDPELKTFFNDIQPPE